MIILVTPQVLPFVSHTKDIMPCILPKVIYHVPLDRIILFVLHNFEIADTRDFQPQKFTGGGQHCIQRSKSEEIISSNFKG